MKKTKKISAFYSIAKGLSVLALMVTTINVNRACYWFVYQGKLPDSAKNLRKF